MRAMLTTTTFQTYERLVGHMESEIQVCLPMLPAGKVAFFLKFGKWLNDAETAASGKLFILPDPSSNLAFPTPLEELSAALFIATRSYPERADVERLLQRYGLAAHQATQSVSSLSGGERFLLSLAKAHALQPSVEGLILSNPTQWLNQSRYGLLAALCTTYLDAGKAVSVAAMEGEHVPLCDGVAGPDGARCAPPARGLAWELELNSLRVEFEPTTFPTYHDAAAITYRFTDDAPRSVRLASPTLVTGDNGAGKSTFGKLVARALGSASGQVQLRCGGSSGPARILLQESIEQLFGKTAFEHIEWAFRFDKERRADAMKIYDSIDAALRAIVVATPDLRQDLIGSRHRPDTLLQGKMALVAERLASRPPLLVLDEPGWGMTVRMAVPFVQQVCDIAHERGTAVALISHQLDVWRALARSRLDLQRRAAELVIVHPSAEGLACCA